MIFNENCADHIALLAPVPKEHLDEGKKPLSRMERLRLEAEPMMCS